jgi:hypothetical protein
MKHGDDAVERLQNGDATPLERRLLGAASSERPSPELSARMAGAIGISLPSAGAPPGGSKGGAGLRHAVSRSKTLVPWLSGAVVAAVVAGAFVAGRGGTPSQMSGALSVVAPSVVSAAVARAAPSALPPRVDEPPRVESEPVPSAPAPASPRARAPGQVAELAAQIALVDAARAALAGGHAERALSIVRDYQMDYPSGTFRPEVSAIKIEALVKLGRKAEARALSERFVKAYGPGPLTERVARLGGLAQP